MLQDIYGKEQKKGKRERESMSEERENNSSLVKSFLGADFPLQLVYGQLGTRHMALQSNLSTAIQFKSAVNQRRQLVSLL